MEAFELAQVVVQGVAKLNDLNNEIDRLHAVEVSTLQIQIQRLTSRLQHEIQRADNAERKLRELTDGPQK